MGHLSSSRWPQRETGVPREEQRERGSCRAAAYRGRIRRASFSYFEPACWFFPPRSQVHQPWLVALRDQARFLLPSICRRGSCVGHSGWRLNRLTCVARNWPLSASVQGTTRRTPGHAWFRLKSQIFQLAGSFAAAWKQTCWEVGNCFACRTRGVFHAEIPRRPARQANW